MTAGSDTGSLEMDSIQKGVKHASVLEDWNFYAYSRRKSVVSIFLADY